MPRYGVVNMPRCLMEGTLETEVSAGRCGAMLRGRAVPVKSMGPRWRPRCIDFLFYILVYCFLLATSWPATLI